MNALTVTIKKIILICVTISILITFIATPSSYAKLDLEDGDFYYSGTTEGAYSPSKDVFKWIVDSIGQIADWLLGLMTLGIRMVFIGWTALLEKILTWTLESTMGVSVDGSIVESDTDLTGLTDSRNNVTVEAIVYNKVAVLNANIFNIEFDRTLSGTGQKLVCDSCSRPVEECVTLTEDSSVDFETVDTSAYCSTYEDAGATKACTCNGCDACTKYIQQLGIDDPIIVKVKRMVAAWYTIIRLLSVVAMLVVLIAVGIKMAISTIASDKAVYKRMLVDWCVGTIMLFSLHYFMYFVVYMSDATVKVIEETASSLNSVKMQHMSSEELEYANGELEVKIYEEIRTRAYDPKLLNGISGMIMYMTLVFMAMKYTVIYLKRLLTIIVLTLMAPAVGVAYALQKALSGKSQVLKTWMTEYIMNVIIQIVHAILYAVFISEALLLSLQNVSGMIVALILMNYVSKADELFKKIFKFGGGDSLLGHTENASEALKQNINTAKGLVMGAKPVAKALTNAPLGLAMKATGKAVLAGGVALANMAYTKRENDAIKAEEAAQEAGEKDKTAEPIEKHNNETNANYQKRRAGIMKQRASDKKAEGLVANLPSDDKKLLEKGGNTLQVENATAEKEYKEALKSPNDSGKEERVNKAREKVINSRRNLNKYSQLIGNIPTTKKIARGRLTRIISMENVFSTTTGYTAITPLGKKFAGTPVQKALAATFGTHHFDKNTLRFVNDGNAVYKQFSPKELLGLTDKDMQEMKAISSEMFKGLGGMVSMFVGMGTLVTEPKAGMALLAAGAVGAHKAFGRNPDISLSGRRYTFSRFDGDSVRSMRNAAIAQAKREHDEITVADIQSRYPGLVEKLKRGGITAGTFAITNGGLALVSNVPFATAVSGAATGGMIVGTAAFFASRSMRNTAIGGRVAKFNREYAKQQKQQMEAFLDEADEVENISIMASMDAKIEHHRREELEKQKKKLAEEAGITYDEKTGEYIVNGIAISSEGIVIGDKKVIIDDASFKNEAQKNRWTIGETVETPPAETSTGSAAPTSVIVSDDSKAKVATRLTLNVDPTAPKDTKTVLEDIAYFKINGQEVVTEINGIEIDTRNYKSAKDVITAYVEAEVNRRVEEEISKKEKVRSAREARRDAERLLDESIDSRTEDDDAEEEESDEETEARVREEVYAELHAVELASDVNKEERQRRRGEADATSDEVVDRLNDREITAADLALMNRELDLLILEFSLDGQLDMDSMATQSKIIRKLEVRLKKLGILKGKETADMLFKKRASGLKQTLKAKSTERNNAIIEAEHSLENALSKDEVQKVEQIVAQITEESIQRKETPRPITAEEVYSRLNPVADGSSRVSSEDGSRRVPETGDSTSAPVAPEEPRTETAKKICIQAIDQYIEAKTVQTSATPSTYTRSTSATEEQKNAAIEKVKQIQKTAEETVDGTFDTKGKVIREGTLEKSQSKVQQALEMLLPDMYLEEPVAVTTTATPASTDSVIQQLRNSRGGEATLTKDGVTVELSQNETKLANSLLEDLFRLKELNTQYIDRQTKEINRGTAEFLQASLDRSTHAVELAKLEKEKIIKENEAMRKPEYLAKTTETEKNNFIDTDPDVVTVANRIKSKQSEVDADRRKMEVRGPIADIEGVVTSQLFSKNNAYNPLKIEVGFTETVKSKPRTKKIERR